MGILTRCIVKVNRNSSVRAIRKAAYMCSCSCSVPWLIYVRSDQKKKGRLILMAELLREIGYVKCE